MKQIKYTIGIFITVLAFGLLSSCEDLTELNMNPNAIDAEEGNVNLLMPAVLGPAAKNYLSLGLENMSGAMQFIQRTGWAGGTNYFDWDAEGWESYYDILRTNDRLIKNANTAKLPFHEGVGLTMRAFLFGQIADYWGDAPYTNALKGNTGNLEYLYPAYDSQETIYKGVLADLSAAAALFATGNVTSVDSKADLYFGGDIGAWEKFANSLAIRYNVRIAEKNPGSKAAVEAIVASGKYISSSANDATMDYVGGTNTTWPLIYENETSSTRNLAGKAVIDQLNATNDPRRSVWYSPVAVRWVEDLTISGESDKMLINGVESNILPDWKDYRGRTEKFTRHFNPNDVTRNTNEYVGVPAGMLISDLWTYNGMKHGAQGRHNYHVSMLSPTFMDGKPKAGDLLKARLLSAAEMHFTLAEMAIKGWNVGNAKSHYESGIKSSLETWGVASGYNDFIAKVAFDGTVKQVLTQKWIASFANATEAWNDYKRTGLPELNVVVGGGARAPVPAVRFGYGTDELNNNTANVEAAFNSLEITPYSGSKGKNSVYSKPWLLQGTGKPW
jgi:hypothetical protein